MSDSDLLLVIVASLLGSLVKSVTGLGYPLVANAIINHGVREERPNIPNFSRLLLPAVAGTAAGTLILVSVAETPPGPGLDRHHRHLRRPPPAASGLGPHGAPKRVRSPRLPTSRFVASITAVFFVVSTVQAAVLAKRR